MFYLDFAIHIINKIKDKIFINREDNIMYVNICQI